MEPVNSLGTFDRPKADVEGSGIGIGGCANDGCPGSCNGGTGCDGIGIFGLFVDCNMVPDAVS